MRMAFDTLSPTDLVVINMLKSCGILQAMSHMIEVMEGRFTPEE
jgi:hypothetical protein